MHACKPLALAAMALVFTACARAEEAPWLPPEQTWIHDPVIAQEGDMYYLFSTGPGVTMVRSPDLQKWQQIDPVFDPPPAWATSVAPAFNGHIWAPDIHRHDGLWYLYYSISSMGKNTSAIGVATTPTLDPDSPEYAWTDHGVVVQSIPYRDLWNAIDPNIIEDADGTPWMSFGSFWGGMKLVKLAEDRRSLAEPQQWYTIAKRERSILVDDADPGPAAVEAPFIIEHEGDYIQFISWDFCCRGSDSSYKIMVGKSDTLTGPYRDRDGKRLDEGGGTLLLEGTERWPGTGHNSVFADDGTEYLVFHAYDPQDDGKSKLHLLPIEWDSEGWPTVDPSPLQ